MWYIQKFCSVRFAGARARTKTIVTFVAQASYGLYILQKIPWALYGIFLQNVLPVLLYKYYRNHLFFFQESTTNNQSGCLQNLNKSFVTLALASFVMLSKTFGYPKPPVLEGTKACKRLTKQSFVRRYPKTKFIQNLRFWKEAQALYQLCKN
ncbi:hypothetical protein EON73_00595 [bacterium]|nr:MAG: hypothetical protein EON73_00595 [bacterium]